MITQSPPEVAERIPYSQLKENDREHPSNFYVKNDCAGNQKPVTEAFLECIASGRDLTGFMGFDFMQYNLVKAVGIYRRNGEETWFKAPEELSTLLATRLIASSESRDFPGRTEYTSERSGFNIAYVTNNKDNHILFINRQ